MKPADFQELLWDKARELYRDMPWRDDTQPYYVLVSEIMLQQTQVERVKAKFHEFVALFPTIESLAAAPLDEVLKVWSGLGYNRRAKFLHEAAKKIVSEYDGVFPSTLKELVTLPGVGPNTAGAILAYSFNQPVMFVETNIRTVYFHHFFDDQTDISDGMLKEIVAETLDIEHPREWYWALMDYGAYLKKQGAGQLDKSKHYKKQAPLKGSIREVRGLILKSLASQAMTESALKKVMPADDRFATAMTGLLRDGLIEITAGRLHLAR